MSSLYSKNNNESTISLFNKKIIYNYDITETGQKSLVDFNLAEKYLYGRVDRYTSIPIQPIRTANNYKLFLNSINPKQSFKGQNFVVDAFHDLSQQFEKCGLLGSIKTKTQYLSSLRVHKGYEDIDVIYSSYNNKYFKKIKEYFTKNNIHFFTLDEFINELFSIVKENLSLSPITKPGFVKSRYCPLSVSGLVVEIADLDHSNNEQKIEIFKNNPNWEFYLNAANSYGFMVDIAQPWRLVADIDSVSMREYQASYGLTSPNQTLLQNFEYTHLEYYNNFINYIITYYNLIKPPFFQVLEECNGKVAKNNIAPNEYTVNTALQEYGNKYFIKWYMMLRFKEEENMFSEQEQKNIINIVFSLERNYSLTKALNYFEKIINPTIDYRGSAAYILSAPKDGASEGL